MLRIVCRLIDYKHYYLYMNEIKKIFGSAIKMRRSEVNLSQEKLAEISKLHRTYISDVERGERNISLINLINLIHSLDISISDFFQNYVADIDKPRADK